MRSAVALRSIAAAPAAREHVRVHRELPGRKCGNQGADRRPASGASCPRARTAMSGGPPIPGQLCPSFSRDRLESTGSTTTAALSRGRDGGGAAAPPQSLSSPLAGQPRVPLLDPAGAIAWLEGRSRSEAIAGCFQELPLCLEAIAWEPARTRPRRLLRCARARPPQSGADPGSIAPIGRSAKRRAVEGERGSSDGHHSS